MIVFLSCRAKSSLLRAKALRRRRDISYYCAGKAAGKMIAGQKIALINRLNPSWQDLGSDVLQDR
jgi:hypothetical protein